MEVILMNRDNIDREAIDKAKTYLSSLKHLYMRIKSLSSYPKEQERLKKWYWTNVERIHQLRDSRASTLLEYRYISCMTWREIADRMGYDDEAYTRRCLHDQSLKAFIRQFPDYYSDYPFK